MCQENLTQRDCLFLSLSLSPYLSHFHYFFFWYCNKICFLGELEILGEKWKKEEILDAKIKKFLAVSKLLDLTKQTKIITNRNKRIVGTIHLVDDKTLKLGWDHSLLLMHIKHVLVAAFMTSLSLSSCLWTIFFCNFFSIVTSCIASFYSKGMPKLDCGLTPK